MGPWQELSVHDERAPEESLSDHPFRALGVSDRVGPGGEVTARLSGNRLLLKIAPRASSYDRRIALFAGVWLTIMLVIALFWTFLAVANAPPLEPVALLSAYGLLSPFVLFGAVLMRGAFTGPFRTVSVEVERERALLVRARFGRHVPSEYPLNERSRAVRQARSRDADPPLQHIALVGSGKPELFGTWLSEDAKDWTIERINEYLASQWGGPAVSSAANEPTGEPSSSHLASSEVSGGPNQVESPTENTEAKPAELRVDEQANEEFAGFHGPRARIEVSKSDDPGERESGGDALEHDSTEFEALTMNDSY